MMECVTWPENSYAKATACLLHAALLNFSSCSGAPKLMENGAQHACYETTQ